MSASLVGSEMCIRDSPSSLSSPGVGVHRRPGSPPESTSGAHAGGAFWGGCLLYTSDAADDM
eukprot:6137471-Alexandrium_andersonii.AAC.1